MKSPPAVPYDRIFYEFQQAGSRGSARQFVPLVLELLHPQSVLDVGCGLGTWLSVFRELGVADVFGVDGAHVNLASLLIERDRFRACDVATAFDLQRTFDLACCLEVAEHVPAASAAGLVRCLTQHAPAVLFSAAIPGQGGTHHVNEQWQDYWARLFEAHGYLPVDCVRPQVWTNRDVESYYAQNMLLFAGPQALETNPALREAQSRTSRTMLSVVHPNTLIPKCDPENFRLKELLAAVGRRLRKSIAFRLRTALGHQPAPADAYVSRIKFL